MSLNGYHPLLKNVPHLKQPSADMLIRDSPNLSSYFHLLISAASMGFGTNISLRHFLHWTVLDARNSCSVIFLQSAQYSS
jgi:hypothetical protein